MESLKQRLVDKEKNDKNAQDIMIENYSKKLKEELKKNEELETELEYYRLNFGNLEQVIQDVQYRLEDSQKENALLKEKDEFVHQQRLADAEKIDSLTNQIKGLDLKIREQLAVIQQTEEKLVQSELSSR